jgi:hypothetical protein
MIIGIWHAKRDPARSVEEYKKFQVEHVNVNMLGVKGCLGVLNFFTETEWGTFQFWQSREADLAEDLSPQSKAIFEALKASGLLPNLNDAHYEWYEINSGYLVEDVFRLFLPK